jgi:uncharacterized protein (TIGR03067 family)
MNAARKTLLVGLIAIAVAGAWARDDEARDKDKAALQGEWMMVAGEREGEPFPEDFKKDAKRIVKDDETSVVIMGQVFMKAKFTIDPSKKPKTIDYDVTEGGAQGMKLIGIYEVDGENAKFCFTTSEGARPTDFTTKADDGRTLSVWKRVKK